MRKGEDGILDLINNYFPNTHSQMPMGRGDDCALLHIPSAKALQAKGIIENNLVAVTSDIFAENAHFRTSYFDPEDIGHKALAVNISDIASNGATPQSFTLNLSLTEKQDFAWLERFFQGMAKLATRYDMVLSGGDLTKVPYPKAQNNSAIDPQSVGGLNIGIIAMGSYEHGGVPLMRHRSYAKIEHGKKNALPCMKKGDILFYIGQVGLARTGLFFLEENHNKTLCLEKYPHATKAHLTPMPLVQEGIFLSHFAKENPLFIMDISDGLMRDIPRLLARQGIIFSDEKSFGANIEIGLDTIHAEVQAYCVEKNLDPRLFAFKGGEDYGLLGVCEEKAFATLQSAWQKEDLAPLHYLGIVTEGDILLNNQKIEEAGFDHFQ